MKPALIVHPTDAAVEQTKVWTRLLTDESSHALIVVLEAFARLAVRGLTMVRVEVQATSATRYMA